jgi:hypothetical protein
MSWVKGDRLKITLEIIAEEPSDETADVWFPAGRSRDWINPTDIEEAGGTVTVEVLPKPVELPTDVYSVVLIRGAYGNMPVTLLPGGTWSRPYGDEMDEPDVRERYVATIYEGGLA